MTTVLIHRRGLEQPTSASASETAEMYRTWLRTLRSDDLVERLLDVIMVGLRTDLEADIAMVRSANTSPEDVSSSRANLDMFGAFFLRQMAHAPDKTIAALLAQNDLPRPD